jgi:hypothetical protein
MPRGAKPGERRGGRAKGKKNRATIEREEQARLAMERLAEVERLRAQEMSVQESAAHTSGIKLAKNVLEDFMRLFAGMAARAQPLPPGVVPPPGYAPNPAEFEKWAFLAVDAAKALAPYQSPRLAAMMVGAAVVNEITVTGGLPDEEDGGLNHERTIEGEPPTEIPPVPKAVND